MKNDSYAGAEEVAALEAQRQEAHDKREVFNAEVEGSKGAAFPDCSWEGTDPASVKARRHALGQYAREDFEPVPLDPIDDYRGPTTGAEVSTHEELRGYVTYREAQAREKYPDFLEVVDNYVIPRLREEGVSPEQVREWILQNDDFIERTYQAGLAEKKRLRNRLPSAKEIENMTAEEFTEKLDALRTGRREEADEKESDEAISRREMKRMNKIANPVDFAKALDAMKWRG